MGNYVSCTLSIAHSVNGSSRRSKIILPDNQIRDVVVGPEVAAAELMLEFPGHFLVNSRSLHIGRHFDALSADEDLEAGGNVYVMFPMPRLNSLVDPADVGPLLLLASRGKEAAGGAHVSAARTKNEEIESRPMRLCRSSRRPSLETIAEESSTAVF